MTFRECMKRPLENLRLSWCGNVVEQTGSAAGSAHGCGRPMHNHDQKYSQSHGVVITKFLKSIERNSSLCLFISEIIKNGKYSSLLTKTEASSFNCPHSTSGESFYLMLLLYTGQMIQIHICQVCKGFNTKQNRINFHQLNRSKL
jgi:hypothetical protein